MEPTLVGGETVLVDRKKAPSVGDLVWARDPDEVDVIKRVHVIAGGIELRGDNPARSTDSRQYGAIPKHWVRGVVVCRMPSTAR